MLEKSELRAILDKYLDDYGENNIEDARIELEGLDQDGEPLPEGVLDGYQTNLKYALQEAESSRTMRRMMEIVKRWHRE